MAITTTHLEKSFGLNAQDTRALVRWGILIDGESPEHSIFCRMVGSGRKSYREWTPIGAFRYFMAGYLLSRGFQHPVVVDILDDIFYPENRFRKIFHAPKYASQLWDAWFSQSRYIEIVLPEYGTNARLATKVFASHIEMDREEDKNDPGVQQDRSLEDQRRQSRDSLEYLENRLTRWRHHKDQRKLFPYKPRSAPSRMREEAAIPSEEIQIPLPPPRVTARLIIGPIEMGSFFGGVVYLPFPQLWNSFLDSLPRQVARGIGLEPWRLYRRKDCFSTRFHDGGAYD